MRRLAPENEDFCEFFCTIYDLISFVNFSSLNLILKGWMMMMMMMMMLLMLSSSNRREFGNQEDRSKLGENYRWCDSLTEFGTKCLTLSLVMIMVILSLNDYDADGGNDGSFWNLAPNTCQTKPKVLNNFRHLVLRTIKTEM